MHKRPPGSSRLVSLLFVIGRRTRDEVHKKSHKPFSSLLHCETLRYVRDHGGPSMRDIADHLLITPPAATLLVDGFVKNNLLVRVIDPRDRRSMRIIVTDRGKNLLRHEMKRKAKEIKKIFSVLSEREIDRLVEILGKVAGEK